ncbi:MAG TPA: hypothetical protein VFN74_15000 [Chloroflexota bacterium]|nr:hypothetical protein [Chloroflexota bacterium]
MEERSGFRWWSEPGDAHGSGVSTLEAVRFLLAVDGWERPSEMADGVAWLIAATLLLNASAKSIRGALDHFGVEEAAAGDGPPMVALDAEDDWVSRLVRRDRLTAWKVGLYAQLLDHQLCAAVDNHAGQKRWASESQRIVAEWSEIDKIPEGVAAMVVNTLARLSAERDRLAALVRQAPEEVPHLDELRTLGGAAWTDWVVPLTICDPVLGIKVALEGMMRREARETGRGRGVMPVNWEASN